MTPTQPDRAGSTVRVFRVPHSSGASLILEQSGRHGDLSHGLGHTRRGDLLDLLTRGHFEDPHGLAAAALQWPAPAPTEVLTPFEPRHVGKILVLACPPREIFEHSAAGDGRAWFSNRSPSTLVASGAQVQLADWTEAGQPGQPDAGLLMHEVFLAAVIARRSSRLDVDESEGCVAGFMVASDFSRRSLDSRPRTPWFGLSPAGTLAIGPAFVPNSCFELGDVTIRASRRRADRVEPQLTRQRGEFALDVSLAIAALSRLAILHPGDLVLIPTGVGLGCVDGGDEVRSSIEGIGELSTSVGRRTRLRQQA